MRSDTILTTGWTFAAGFDPDHASTEIDGAPVEVPHNAVDLPLSYFDETAYQRAFTYQRWIDWDATFEDAEVMLRFDGAMADSTVWVNGVEVVRHADGYTPFTARLTPHLRRGERALVTLRIDGTENPEIPPFGGQIDYLTYAGLYRDVHLIVVPRLGIANVKIETHDILTSAQRVTAHVHLACPGGTGPDATIAAILRGPDGTEVTRRDVTVPAGADKSDIAFDDLSGLALWSPDTPALHTLDLTLASDHGEDTLSTRFGLRTAEFTPDGFLLNGEPLKLMGLNRHQSFPYSGYAQGRRSQERDAEICKHDFGCNLIRTSHYPQSTAFLDRCDEIGLLVFEEIPGWQHIGGAAWKAESVQNVRRMIERDWNHPAIVIWGVRINESDDDHDFYSATNGMARDLDPTRQTGGVRYITDSEMLEDVYTMNDFILGDFENPFSNRPRTALRDQTEVTGLKAPVPYMVTEYNGHMFPTKAGDPEQRQAEHVTRHLDVLNAMFGDPHIAGCIGWCMFDYNTHKDFGAGDRICHHGVANIFREPKFAAHAYASQRPRDAGIVLKPVTFWARGERNIGGVLPLIVLTNCDAVELRYGGLTKRVEPDRERYPHLPHAPVVIDHRHFSRDELGRWGMSWEDCTITGLVDGEPAATQRFVADPLPTTLEVAPDATTLDAGARDEVRVIVRALDQAGNVLPFLADCVDIAVSGPATLIGPPRAHFQGGTTGFWLRASGDTGAIEVTLTTARFDTATLTLTAR